MLKVVSSMQTFSTILLQKYFPQIAFRASVAAETLLINEKCFIYEMIQL